MIIPRQKVPDLNISLLDQEKYILSSQTKGKFNLLVFYRGLHCPLCLDYLTELKYLTYEFFKRKTKIIAISSDNEDRAQQMYNKIGRPDFPIGYNLPLSTASAWGLYISEGRGKTSVGIEEPAKFSEPGVFIIRTDQTLYYANIQTMVFARPSFKGLLQALDFAIEKNYRARGEYVENF